MKLSSCFFSDLVSLSIITRGKLIGYEKARDLLHKYVSLFFFANYNYYLKRVFIIDVFLTVNRCTPFGIIRNIVVIKIRDRIYKCMNITLSQ